VSATRSGDVARLACLLLAGELKEKGGVRYFLVFSTRRKRPVNEGMINAVDIMLVLYSYMLLCCLYPGRYCLINLNVCKQTSIYTRLFTDCLYAALAVTTTTTTTTANTTTTTTTTTTTASPSGRAV